MENPLEFMKRSDRVRILAPTGVLTSSFLTQFEKSEDFTVELVEVPNANELLKELFRSDGPAYDLVLFSSFLSDSIIHDHHFQKLKKPNLEPISRISVDFLRLKSDPNNTFTIPLLWGVNGWLVPKEDGPFRLELGEHIGKLKLSLLSDPGEAYATLTKLKPILKTWVETGQKNKLNELKSFFKNFDMGSNKPRGFKQIPSGQLSTELLKDHRYLLAKERSHLWIINAAIPKGSNNPGVAHEFLTTLLADKWSLALANSSQMATVNPNLDDSKLLPYFRQAGFVRSFPLNKFELYSRHEAFEPIFMSILQNHYPKVFKANSFH